MTASSQRESAPGAWMTAEHVFLSGLFIFKYLASSVAAGPFIYNQCDVCASSEDALLEDFVIDQMKLYYSTPQRVIIVCYLYQLHSTCFGDWNSFRLKTDLIFFFTFCHLPPPRSTKRIDNSNSRLVSQVDKETGEFSSLFPVNTQYSWFFFLISTQHKSYR